MLADLLPGGPRVPESRHESCAWRGSYWEYFLARVLFLTLVREKKEKPEPPTLQETWISLHDLRSHVLVCVFLLFLFFFLLPTRVGVYACEGG